MSGSLFACLPEQRAPAEAWTDNAVLRKCRRCDGTGIERCPYPRSHPRWLDWDDRCFGRGCKDGLIYEVWPLRDCQ
jgi:hypothetical protein